MNYTMIAYEADSSFHDRCGDFISQPGKFVTFFSEDINEFAKRLAEADHEGGWDELIILLNGRPEEHWGDEEIATHYELNDLRWDAYQKVLKAAEQAKAEQAALAKEAAEKALAAANEKQRLADVALFEALKIKLGK